MGVSASSQEGTELHIQNFNVAGAGLTGLASGNVIDLAGQVFQNGLNVAVQNPAVHDSAQGGEGLGAVQALPNGEATGVPNSQHPVVDIVLTAEQKGM
jgi:hypothetical protein